jgi:membrane-associated phospholipid phosphatase
VQGALAGAGVGLLRTLPLADHVGAVPIATENVVFRWNEAILAVIRAARPAPTVAARALAVTYTAVFDAWAAYDERAVGTVLGGRLRRPPHERTVERKAEAISRAAWRALVDLFPAHRAPADGLLRALGFAPDQVTTDTSLPARVGNIAATAVLAVRHSDGANQLGDLMSGAYSDYTGYAPLNPPDTMPYPAHWQPLRVPDGAGGSTVQRFATPHWGLVLPFALRDGAQLRPSAPALYPSADYDAQARLMVDYSAGLTDEHKAIAEYWADGPGSETPPGHWCMLAQWVAERDGYGLDRSVQLYLALANALLDASIAAWDAKRAFDYVRPICTVRIVFGGQQVTAWGGPYRGPQVIDGEAWMPYQLPTVLTPPFAEFVSGHSTFSAAAAEVLRRFTGSERFGSSYTVPAGSSKIEPGATPAADVTLTWPTFSAAADQAGLSRRYGGIHFPQADLAGRTLGQTVGRLALARALEFITGRAEVSSPLFAVAGEGRWLKLLDGLAA